MIWTSWARVPLLRIAGYLVANEPKIVCNAVANVLGRETLRARSSRVGRTRTRQTTGLSLRGVISAFALLAFIISGFATQTHIHIPAQSGFGIASTAVGNQKIAAKSAASLDRERPSRTPADDPANCPLCQEYLVAGAYVTPAPIALPVPTVTVIVTQSLIQSIAFARAATHSWLSRAPPLA